MTRLPLRTGEADMVVCFSGLHMLADPREALREFARCLRPGGLLTGTTFLLDDLSRRARTPVRDRTPPRTRDAAAARRAAHMLCTRPASPKRRSARSRASPPSARAGTARPDGGREPSERCTRATRASAPGRLSSVDVQDLARHERRPPPGRGPRRPRRRPCPGARSGGARPSRRRRRDHGSASG